MSVCKSIEKYVAKLTQVNSNFLSSVWTGIFSLIDLFCLHLHTDRIRNTFSNKIENITNFSSRATLSSLLRVAEWLSSLTLDRNEAGSIPLHDIRQYVGAGFFK
jgi:hypothetical protein